MPDNLTKNTTISEGQKFFTIGWFRFPVDVDDNYEVVVVLHDILVVSTLLLNPILLYIIFKTFKRSTGKNSSILIASICLTNMFVSFFGMLKLIGVSVVDYHIMTRVMSIFLPMYFLATFCLALNNYGLIVTPLKFKSLSPNPRTMVCILMLVWISLALLFILAPSLASDFDLYAKVMLTTVVALCWLASIVIGVMYAKIVVNLYRRKLILRRTLNLSRSRQGLVVIKQNSRLAQVLFFYVMVLVVLTLPLFTSVILVLHCPACNQPANVKFTLYMLPAAMSMPVIHVFHWLFATPQYHREMKRLAKKLFVVCGIVKKE